MQSNQVKASGIDYTGNSIPCLSIFKVKSKPIPFWVNARIHIDTNGNTWFEFVFLT